MIENIVTKAWRFAHEQHSRVGQLRKYSLEPYINHPVQVANLLIQYVPDVTEHMIAAALLHDVVEDTGVQLDTIMREFGLTVSSYVYFLTDVAIPSDGNRATRMAINNKHIEVAPAEVHSIKAADIAHNVYDIVKHDPRFAMRYVKEKRLAQKSISKANPAIMAYLESVLTSAEQQLYTRGNT